jgi:hypothetical protein
VSFSGPWDQENVEGFVAKYSFPLISQLDHKAVSQLEAFQALAVVLVVDVEFDVETLVPIAKAGVEYPFFFVNKSDATQDRGDEASLPRLTVSSVPSALLFDAQWLAELDLSSEWLAELDLSSVQWVNGPQNLVEVVTSAEHPYWAIVGFVAIVLSLVKATRDHVRFGRMRNLANRKNKSSPWQGGL